MPIPVRLAGAENEGSNLRRIVKKCVSAFIKRGSKLKIGDVRKACKENFCEILSEEEKMVDLSGFLFYHMKCPISKGWSVLVVHLKNVPDSSYSSLYCFLISPDM